MEVKNMIKIPPKTEYVIEQLEKNGFEAYIVGGCVRDMLLGLKPFDFDVTTSAKPEEIMEIFERTVNRNQEERNKQF